MRQARGVQSTAYRTTLLAALAIVACEAALGEAPRTAADERGGGLEDHGLVSSQGGLACVASPEGDLVSSKDGLACLASPEGGLASPEGDLVSAEGGLASPEGDLVSAEGGLTSAVPLVSLEDGLAPQHGVASDEAPAAPGDPGEGSAGSRAPRWEPVETDWCSHGWIGLDEHTCFHVPESAAADAPILYVLHGVMAPDTLPVGLQDLAARAADALGVVAVFPKGKQGLCVWDPSVARSLCWPTRRELVDAEAPALLTEWMRAEARLSQVLGHAFPRRYVIGFSNGGYFASYIALEGLLHVDGVGLVGAGRSVIEEELFSQERPPIYIAVGELETAGVIASAENLADMLIQHGWEHELVVHPGRRHEIQADDFLLAWETWTAR